MNCVHPGNRRKNLARSFSQLWDTLAKMSASLPSLPFFAGKKSPAKERFFWAMGPKDWKITSWRCWETSQRSQVVPHNCWPQVSLRKLVVMHRRYDKAAPRPAERCDFLLCFRILRNETTTVDGSEIRLSTCNIYIYI